MRGNLDAVSKLSRIDGIDESRIFTVSSNLLSHIYKGALLTSLITIRYTEPIDTMTQMEDSGLPLYCLGKTHVCIFSNSDPVMDKNKMKDRRFDIPFPGWVPDKYLEE